MRSRDIKPGFYKSEQLADCSVWARYIFPGLWMLADREGRLEDRPRRIRAEVLPYDGDRDIEALLSELDRAGLIVRYEAEGGRYIWIPRFSAHQNPHPHERAAGIPPCPENWAEIRAERGRDAESSDAAQAGPSPSGGEEGAVTCHDLSRHVTECHDMERHVTTSHDLSCNVLLTPSYLSPSNLSSIYPSPETGDGDREGAGFATSDVSPEDSRAVAADVPGPSGETPGEKAAERPEGGPPDSPKPERSPRRGRPKASGVSPSREAAPGRRAEFEEWYGAYPKKVGRQAASASWDRAVKAGRLPELPVLLHALEWQVRQEQWQNPQYIPHPATYLNQQRWQDEPPKTAAGGTHRFGVPTARPGGWPTAEDVARERTAQNCREVLAELRAERGE